MKNCTFLFVVIVLLTSFSALATDLGSVSVRYKKNGVNHTVTIQPYGSGTINPDHGSQVRVLVWRQQDIPTPVEYFLSDWGNGEYYSQTTSNFYVIFEDCAGPFDTHLTVGVNTMVGAVTVNVNWQQPSQPDLIVSNVSVNHSTNSSGKSYLVGQNVVLNSAVWNIGGATAGPSKLGYYIKTSEGNTTGSPFSWRQIYTLQPGQNLGYEVNYTFTSNDVGTRYFVFEADYLDEVDEANENNNVRSFGPFTVVSPPSLSLSPTNHNFGSHTIDQCSGEHTFVLSNEGGSTVSGSVSFANGSHFTFVSGGGNYTLNAGQSKEIKVKFCPESAGTKNDQLRVYMSGQTAPITQSSLSGTGVLPPEVIIGISDEFVFDTRLFNSGGIYLEVIETAGTNPRKVKKVGYQYSFKESSWQINPNIVDAKFEVQEDGRVFLSPPSFPDNVADGSKNDFLNQILLFDENDNRIGYINFSYSFEWEGMNSRHAVIFFHNDGEIFGGDPNDPVRYFPYHRLSPNNPTIAGLKVRYNYYSDGDYPVSMLIPPHSAEDNVNNIPQGYRFIPNHGLTKKPILFVHGLTGTFSYQEKANPSQTSNTKVGDQVSYWFDTERKLNAKLDNTHNRVYHAWQFYYPNEDDLMHCGMMLEKAVDYLTKRYTEPLNFVSHSMGGLVTLEYLTKPDIYCPQKIGKVVLSMSPIYGSLAANKMYNTLLGYAMGEGSKISKKLNMDGKAPAYRDLSIGSDFLFNLHGRIWPDGLIDNTLTFIGLTTNSYRLPKYLHVEAKNFEDGIVSFGSASLLDKNIGFVGYYGNHDDGKYSKTIDDENFFPELVHQFFNDESEAMANFIDYCLDEENHLVKVFVEGNANVVKPAGMNLENLTINKNDANFQRGMVTLVSPEFNYSVLDLWYQSIDNTYRLETSSVFPSKPGYVYLGDFIKNRFAGKQYEPNWYHYFFSKGIFNDAGFSFHNNNSHCESVLLHVGNMWPIQVGEICIGYMKHKFHFLDDYYLKQQLYASQETPTKKLSLNDSLEVKQSILYVDDQANEVEFYFYSEDAYFADSHYSFTLQTPTGNLIDSASIDVDYYEFPFTTVKRITIQNPEPGGWIIEPVTDVELNNAFNFISKAHLNSEIKAYSRIPQDNHFLNSSIQLSGFVETPDNEFVSPGSINAYIILNNGLLSNDTIFLDNIVAVDTGYIFSKSFIADNIGVYNYVIIVEGVYNNFQFERAVYGDFVVSNAVQKMSIPNIELNITQPFFELLLQNHLLCALCDLEDLVFEINIDSTTFINDNLYYQFDPEANKMLFVANTTGPSANAFFTVGYQVSDTLFLSDSFRVSFTAAVVPDYLSASDITLNSVNLSWIPRGLEQHWDIKYGPAGFNPETEGTLIAAITERPYLLEDLTQSTSYDFYVRAVYDDDAHSAWSWPASFITNHLIIADSGNNGQMEPEGNIEVTHRNNQLFQIIPSTGYHIDDVLVDGASNGAVEFYLFEDVQQSHTIHAEFAINLYTITAQPNNDDFGNVTGAGEYEHFEEVTLTATSATGYHFLNWTEDGEEVSTDPVYFFTAEGERNLTANFAINVYTITAEPNNEDFGTVTGAGVYEHFAEVTLTATPATGYQFLNWTEEGEEVFTDATFVFMAEAVRHFMAHFEPETSVIKVEGQEIILHPNPFNHTFTIQNATHVLQVIMTNLLGQQILYKQLRGSETETISTENLPKGVYLVQIIMENGIRKTVKMIKE